MDRELRLIIAALVLAALALIGTITGIAQGGSYCTMSTWEPRNIATKAGIVASYDPGNTGANVSNPAGWAVGSGVSALSNRVTLGSADLLQGTAANQPLLSRADNSGNICLQSSQFSTTWIRARINAFGATDTGATGVGSFANTARTTDPLGGNTADFIQEDGTAASTHTMSQVISSYSGDYKVSLYAKLGGAPSVRTWIAIQGAGSRSAYFDLQNGVVGTVTASTTASIASAGNGWYLCSITFTGASPSPILFLASADGVAVYNGDNTSGLFLWGASLRPSTWDTNYIATTTVPIHAGLGGRQVMYFDGAAYTLKTAAFTLNQPTEVYTLVNALTWTLNDALFDGDALNSGKLYQADTTPKIRATAGTATAEFTPPPLGTWRVHNVVFDGASSRMSTNSGAFTVADAGAGNMGGFTLGAAGTAGTTYWNGEVARTILCNKTNETAEASYIRWGLLKQASLY